MCSPDEAERSIHIIAHRLLILEYLSLCVRVELVQPELSRIVAILRFAVHALSMRSI